MRQTQSRKVLFKLLTRIKITEDSGPLRQLMRLRCFSVMANIFEDYVDDAELVLLVRGYGRLLYTAGIDAIIP